mmetsp:Transcript_28146/g.42524  ORF Transcript_28146/g.42524 Transcript_28146/m.42524 type:complete len:149 (-) Transcript_28146:81-527(-)
MAERATLVTPTTQTETTTNTDTKTKTETDQDQNKPQQQQHCHRHSEFIPEKRDDDNDDNDESEAARECHIAALRRAFFDTPLQRPMAQERPPGFCSAVGAGSDMAHSYHTFRSSCRRNQWLRSVWPFRRYTGTCSGKNMGNQLNMPFE